MDQDREVGETCRLLHLNWNRVLELDRARAILETEKEVVEPPEAVEEYTHEEHYCKKTAFGYEDLDQLSVPSLEEAFTEPEEEPEVEEGYSHAEHFGEDCKATAPDSDSECELRFEGNCCWRGGVVIDYSSDCDWS